MACNDKCSKICKVDLSLNSDCSVRAALVMELARLMLPAAAFPVQAQFLQLLARLYFCRRRTTASPRASEVYVPSSVCECKRDAHSVASASKACARVCKSNASLSRLRATANVELCRLNLL